MNQDFQDSIDAFILRPWQMTDREKRRLMLETEEDTDKWEQLALTQDVTATLASREDKLKAMRNFQNYYSYSEHQDMDACSNYCCDVGEEKYFHKTQMTKKAAETEWSIKDDLLNGKRKNAESTDSIEQKNRQCHSLIPLTIWARRISLT